MKNIVKVVVFSAVILTPVSFADVWEVPEDFPNGIQEAINDERVHDGDTISVWGETIPASTTSISSVTRAYVLSTAVFCQGEVERNLSRRLVIGE